MSASAREAGHLLDRFALRLTQFRVLNPQGRRVLLAAALLLPLFWAGLHLLGLARFHAAVTRRPVRARAMAADSIPAYADAVDAAARHSPFPVTCLTRSLLLAWLLRRRGVPTVLRIGVRIVDGTLDAHAWLERDGLPVNDRPGVADDYPPFHQPLPAAAFNLGPRGS
jgi:hypothetical protein